MQSYKDFLNENQGYNGQLLNDLIKKLYAERQNAIATGGTGGKNTQLQPQEFSELKNVANIAKQKVIAMVRQHAQDWQIYKQWAQQHESKTIRLTRFSKLPTFIRLGQQTMIDGETLICNQDFYNILTWRQHVKDFESLTHNQSLPMVDIVNIIKGLNIMKPLIV